MKLLLFLLIFTSSPNSHATSLIQRWLESIKNLNAPLTQETPCCDTEEKQLLNQCLRDLCGDSGKIDTIFISNRSFEESYRDPKLDQEFEAFKPQLIEFGNKTKQTSLYHIENIEKKLASNPNLFDVTKFTQEDLDRFADRFLQEEAKVIAKPDEDDVEIEFSTDFKNEYPELSKHYAEYKKKYILNNVANKIGYGVFTLDETKSIIQQDAKEIELAIVAFENYSPTSNKILEIKNKLSTAVEKLSGGQDNPWWSWSLYGIFNDLNNLKQDLHNLTPELPENLRELVKINIRKYSSESYICEKSAGCEILVKNKLQALKPTEILDQARHKLNDKEKLDEIIQSCRYNWYSDKFSRSDKEVIEDFRKNLPEIQKKVLEHGLGFFSEHSKQNFTKMITDLNHKLPKDKKDTGSPNLDQFKDNFQSFSEMTVPTGEYNSDLNSIYYNLMQLESPYNFLEMDCQNVMVTASDYYTAQDGPENHINISSFSCDHPHHGQRIYAHEIGHTISDWMHRKKFSSSSHEKYAALRSCVQSNYIDKGSPIYHWSHDGDKEKTEEDMADVIGHLTFNNVDAPLLFCSLVEPHSNGIDYISGPVNDTTNGPHSAGIVRVLHEALFRSIPIGSACEKILNENKEYLQLKKCVP